MSNNKKPWSRNQKLTLCGLIIAAASVIIRFEIKISFIQKEINRIKIKQAQIEQLEAKAGTFETIVASKTIASTGTGQSIFGQGVVINSGGGKDKKSNFQVKGSHDEEMIFGQAETDCVGIGTSSPRAKLDVIGNLRIEKTVTGMGNGNDLCVDKNNVFCLCGQCEE